MREGFRSIRGGPVFVFWLEAQLWFCTEPDHYSPKGIIMRTGILTLAGCGLVLLSTAHADEGNKGVKDAMVREIDLKGGILGKTTGVATKPTKIANAEQLAQAIPDQESRDRIAKQVDFDKEELLFFVWIGSTTDRLSFEVEKTKNGPVAVFSYKEGPGEDAPYPRFRLYAIAKNWRVDQAKQRTRGMCTESAYRLAYQKAWWKRTDP